MKVIVGDIGGTHSRLAIVRLESGRPTIERKERYPSRSYDGLAPVVREFIGKHDRPPDRAVFAVACPIEEGACRLPNLGWEIDAASLADAIAVPHTSLINDFDAVAHAIPLLGPDDLAPIQGEYAPPAGILAIIGAGTGLGMAMAFADGSDYHVHASEGGHADFAPGDARQDQLLAFLRDRFGHVSIERVVSGPGLVNIYDFVTASGRAPAQPHIRREMDASADSAAVVAARGMDGSDPASAEALDIFVTAYGSAAGSLALTVRADAVYVTGGIAPKILGALRAGSFLAAFRAKGRVSDVVAHVPVFVIVNPDVGLLGAARTAVAPPRRAAEAGANSHA